MDSFRHAEELRAFLKSLGSSRTSEKPQFPKSEDTKKIKTTFRAATAKKNHARLKSSQGRKKYTNHKPRAQPLLGRKSARDFYMRALPQDGRSQKAKQKRLISTISLFSLVFKRRATGEKAPSSAHRESAKSALFL